MGFIVIPPEANSPAASPSSVSVKHRLRGRVTYLTRRHVVNTTVGCNSRLIQG